jgi:hypothetical protein
MPQRLSEVVAVQTATKQRVDQSLGGLVNDLRNPSLFQGLMKEYTPLDEEGERLTPEFAKVALTADAVLKRVTRIFTPLFDVTAEKELGNYDVLVDVKVDDEVIIEGVPATYLLFLEREINRLIPIVVNLPELAPTENWILDEAAGFFKTEPTQTHRTKKVDKALVLYPATDKHPAQTEKIKEDIVVGHWKLQKHSGGITKARKDALLDRLTAFERGVKCALGEANASQVKAKKVGEKVFKYLFAN